jgi:hypothetical protein
VEGAVAQEENMFRRTDCHFRISEDEYDARLDRYLPEITRLLSAEDGLVILTKPLAKYLTRLGRRGCDVGEPFTIAERSPKRD